MTEIVETFAYVAVGAELLAGAVDISKYDREGIKELVKGLPDKYLIDVDDATKEMFNLPTNNVIREKGVVWCLQKIKKKEHQPNLTLTIDKTKQIMEVLYNAGIEKFNAFDETEFIEGYKEKMKALDAGVDYAKAPECEIKNKLRRIDTDFALKTFLAICDYPNNYSFKLYDDSKKDKVFHLESFKDFEVVDNRIIIPFKPSDIRFINKKMLEKGYKESEYPDEMRNLKAFVISKNVYDYFWASYGNKFQSCFSLNSDYGYLFGYIPFAIADESFICYATTGGVNKIPIVSGKQFTCPNMIFRAWGYAAADDGYLLIDKRYTASSEIYRQFTNVILDRLQYLFKVKAPTVSTDSETALYNQGKGMYKAWQDTGIKFYSDSLRRCNEYGDVDFCYNCGEKTSDGRQLPWEDSNFLRYSSKIKDVSASLDLSKPVAIVDGVLINPRICPKTGLVIPEELTESPYAKYLTVSSKHTAVISYIDGRVFLDTSTEDYKDNSRGIYVGKDKTLYYGFFSGCLWVTGYDSAESCESKNLTLKSLKEYIKGHIKDTPYDVILLRIIEKDSMKFQQFRR